MVELSVLDKLNVIPTNPFVTSIQKDESNHQSKSQDDDNNINNETSTNEPKVKMEPAPQNLKKLPPKTKSNNKQSSFKLQPRPLTNLDELEDNYRSMFSRNSSPKPIEKKKPGRPRKDSDIDLYTILNIPKKKGRPKSENLTLIRADNIITSPRKRGRGRLPKVKDPLLLTDGKTSQIVPQESESSTPTPSIEPKASLETRASMKWCVVEFEEKDVLVQSARDNEDFDSDGGLSTYNSDGSSTDWKPRTRGYGKRGRQRSRSRSTEIKQEDGDPNVTKQRGRPRKYPKKDPNDPKKPRGRPKKESTEPLLVDGIPLPTPAKQSKPRVVGTPKFKTRPKLEPKPKEIPGIVEFEYDDDIEDDLTKFIYVKAEDEERKKGEELKKGPGRPKFSELEKQRQIIHTEVFSSPKKQKLGSITLSTTPSPSKKGILNITGSSPSRTPNGRAGSPRKVRKQLQDQSARKKATRVLYSQLMDDGVEDDEEHEQETKLAERIIKESQKSVSAAPSPFNTPRKNQVNLPAIKSDFVPTPLPSQQEEESFFDSKYDDKALFLDGPEGYFDQHRTKVKTSNHSMVQAPQLEYDEFNSLVLMSGFLHHNEKQTLINTYKEMYTQWYFELSEGFSLVFFGIGSKRRLLLHFVEEYLTQMIDVPTIVINGYNPASNFKEIITTIVSTLKLKKVPTRLGDLVEYIVEYYQKREKSIKLIILVHNIDGQGLRDEKTQIYLSKLASIRQIHFITSIDHINAPLLWDSTMLANFNFVWHNTTTFADYLTETSFQDILTLGQTQKSAGSKGAKYVLSSLTTNSKNLYRVLVSNQLQNMEDDLISKKAHGAGDNQLKGTIKHALEYKNFYTLCAEEFISSNEINFRTMLMEFVEHKMAILTKDQTGTEYVFIPFSLEELQKLLEDELL